MLSSYFGTFVGLFLSINALGASPIPPVLPVTDSLRHEVGIFGRDDRVIRNTGNAPFGAVGRLFNAYVPTCTAFLVARNVVLTAAHCVAVGEPYWFQIQRSSNLADANVNRLYQVVEISKARNYAWANSPYGFPYLQEDFAVLRLESRVPESVPRLSIASSATVAQRAMSVGYPSYGYEMASRVVDPNCSVRAVHGGAIYGDCGMSRGNSGGPLLVADSSGNWSVAGVCSTQHMDGNGMVLGGAYNHSIANVWTNITLYSARIQAVITRFSSVR